MGEAPDIPRPIWRTPLAVALVAWIVIVPTATLAAARLLEVTPGGGAPFVLLAIYVLPLPVLLVWSFWAMMREPVTGWMAPTVLMTFCGAFVPVFGPLLDAGVRLNFEAHRPTYTAIAADARAGRLTGVANARGWISGERRDVRFRFRAADPGVVDFVWIDDFGVKAGIRYDDTPCIARPGVSCVDRGEPLAERYSYYARFF